MVCHKGFLLKRKEKDVDKLRRRRTLQPSELLSVEQLLAKSQVLELTLYKLREEHLAELLDSLDKVGRLLASNERQEAFSPLCRVSGLLQGLQKVIESMCTQAVELLDQTEPPR